ncbi:hypothetical protein [Streptomyces sp. NPDC059080]
MTAIRSAGRCEVSSHTLDALTTRVLRSHVDHDGHGGAGDHDGHGGADG